MCKLVVFTEVKCSCPYLDCPHDNLDRNSKEGKEHRRTHAKRTHWEHCVAWQQLEFDTKTYNRNALEAVCWNNGSQARAEFGGKAPQCPDGHPGIEAGEVWYCPTCALHHQYYTSHASGRY